MTISALSIRRARAGVVAGVVAAALLVASAVFSAPASASAQPNGKRPPVGVTVMTRNLYLGADFTPLLTVAPGDLTAAVLTILGAVRASQPDVRMQQVATEIHRSAPDVVDLQEAAVWTSAVPGVPALNYSYDFTALILADLATLGDHYSVAIDQANFDSLNDLSVGSLLPGRFVDHDVMLVRTGTRVLSTGGAHFTSQLTYANTPIGPVTFTRGYEWAALVTHGFRYRSVNAHLEAYDATVAGTQAAEIIAALNSVSGPILVGGDMNSDPNLSSKAAAVAFTNAHYRDAWPNVHFFQPGFTCCEDGSLTGPPDGSALDQRIDHVYSRNLMFPRQAWLVGVAAFELTAPMWPSDHAGLVVRY